MNTNSGSSRWWENYLVRYFMPSIAGIAIVSWLSTIAGTEFRDALFFGKSPSNLDAPTLTLLILYGNLFCYVASYPILCFHATRVIDFKDYKCKGPFLNCYVQTYILGIFVLLSVLCLSGKLLIFFLFMFIITYVALQIYRIKVVLGTPKIKGYQKRPTSLLYAFLITLSKRRGVIVEKTITISEKEEDEEQNGAPPDKTSKEKESRWRREFIESYRHMREHGNSAFIFTLEIILSGVCYGVLIGWPGEGVKSISVISIIFVIWSMPAVLVHLLGQHLERRFSIFDRRLKDE